MGGRGVAPPPHVLNGSNSSDTIDSLRPRHHTTAEHYRQRIIQNNARDQFSPNNAEHTSTRFLKERLIMTGTAKRLLLTAAFAITGFIATQTAAMAQTYTCIFVNGCKVLVVLDPCGNVVSTQTDCGSTGSGTFSGQPIPVVGPLNVALVPQNITASVQDPVYGAINTTLDRSRTTQASTIISNNADTRFPATGIIRFNATATIGSIPGATYASRTPLEFTNRNLQSVNPFVNETFTLSNDVEFYSTTDLSQSTAFRLSVGSSVTLGSGPAVPPQVPQAPQVPGDGDIH
jgi:hypothetical protein